MALSAAGLKSTRGVDTGPWLSRPCIHCGAVSRWTGAPAFSLQDQIAQFFRSAIADGRVPTGKRVSSSRQLAVDFGVSRTTAVEAYERLVAEGSPGDAAGRRDLHSRPATGAICAQGNGCWPCGRPNVPTLTRLDGRNYLLPLAPGMPTIDRFPWSTWARLTNQVCHERPLNAVGYGDPQGELALRQTIAEYLATSRGILCDADQIVVMAGSVQSLDFMIGQIATAGDSVWVEEPSGAYMRSTFAKPGWSPSR